MQTIRVALAIIKQGKSYHLQLRNHKTSSGGNNRIGCFGGVIEANETPLEAVVREIREETSIVPDAVDFKLVGEVTVESDYRGKPARVEAHAFVTEVSGDLVIESHEGQLVTLSQDQVIEKIEHMTTGTAAVFKQFILKG